MKANSPSALCPMSASATSRQHGFIKRYGLVRDASHEFHQLWCPFGEVQQNLLLSSLTIGEAYCLLEVLQWIPHNRWRRQCSVRQHGDEIARRCPHFGARVVASALGRFPAAHRSAGNLSAQE